MLMHQKPCLISIRMNNLYISQTDVLSQVYHCANLNSINRHDCLVVQLIFLMVWNYVLVTQK